MRPCALLLCVGALGTLSGCIVGEIRDELRGVNDNLTEVQASLDKLDETNERILKTNDSIARTNILIDEVEKGLGRIDSTNASLGAVDKRLMLLASIDMSLTRLDGHLASLRGTITKLDSAIPFLDLGGGDVPPEEPTAAAPNAEVTEVAAQPAGVAQPAAPGAEKAAETADPKDDPAVAAPATAPTQPARKTPDPLQGTWLVRYPSENGVFVFLPDGNYIRVHEDSSDPSPEVRGTWKRSGNKLLLTQTLPVRYQRRAGAPQPTDAEARVQPKDNPNMEPAPAVEQELEVISASVRSATVRFNGRLHVLVRPT